MHDECSGKPSIIMDDIVELMQERIMENHHFTIYYGTQQLFPAHFPLLVAQNCHGTPVVQKIVCQVGAKATDTTTESKSH